MSAAARVLEHNAMVYRRTWRGSVFSTVVSPVFFLASMGIGLGGYVDRSGGSLAGVSYLVFLAPGLLAAQAMQTAASESTWSVMGKIVWDKTYFAMLATPLAIRDLLLGELAWLTVRLTMVAATFLVVMGLFGAIHSPFGLLTLPAAVLTGLAFGAPIIAFSASQRRDTGFNVLFRFVITPLFLFSGTFFPIERLPGFLQPVAWVTPLYHGVALTRGLALGRIDPLTGLLHVAVLLGFAAVGVAAGLAVYRRRLVV
ncbi:MAG: ABC transporter permease [Candidatus Limnocylindrales bacterium]